MTSYQFILPIISHLPLHCSSHLTNPVKDGVYDITIWIFVIGMNGQLILIIRSLVIDKNESKLSMYDYEGFRLTKRGLEVDLQG